MAKRYEDGVVPWCQKVTVFVWPEVAVTFCLTSQDLPRGTCLLAACLIFAKTATTMMARALIRLSAFFAVVATVDATLEKGIIEVEEVG